MVAVVPRRSTAPSPPLGSVPRWIPFAVLVAATVIAIGAGLLLPTIQMSRLNLVIVAIAVVTLTPVVVEWFRGTLDTLSPLPTFVATWCMMFVVRPIASLDSGDTTLRRRYEVGEYFESALILALLGAIAFLVGYYLPLWRRQERTAEPHPHLAVPPKIVLTLVLASTLPGVLVLLSSFGEEFSGSTAYIYFAPLLVSTGGITLIGLGLGDSQHRGSRLMLWVGIVLFSLFGLSYLIVGQRFFVLLACASLGVFLVTRSGRRISLGRMLLVAAVMIFGFLGPLLTWRSDELASEPFSERLRHTVQAIPQAWETLAEGESTEMLPALALQLSTEGTYWSSQPGYLPTQILGHWIPRTLWPEKNVSVPELLYRTYFPEHYAQARANAQFSVLGEFFYDSRYLGVVLGMGLIGFGSRAVWERFKRRQHSLLSHLIYAPFLPLLLILLRGDAALILSLALFIYLPLVVTMTVLTLVSDRIAPSTPVTANVEARR